MREKVEYPKWKYHAEKKAVIVRDRASELALGASWADSPADVRKAPQAVPAPSPKHEESLVHKIGEFLHHHEEAPKKIIRKVKA